MASPILMSMDANQNRSRQKSKNIKVHQNGGSISLLTFLLPQESKSLHWSEKLIIKTKLTLTLINHQH